MSRYLDPTNDVAFKKLFLDKDRLMDLLNNVLKLDDGYKIVDLDYIPTEQMPIYKDGRRSLFDLKVKDESGRHYVVEIQRKMNAYYLNRAQYYACYTYISQLQEGVTHDALLPVIIVSIIGDKAFPDEVPCISYHKLREDTTQKQYLFSVSYVFVELGKFNKDKIENDTDQWLHLLKCASKEQEPPKEIKNKRVLSAYERLEQYNWSKEEHDAYVTSRLAAEAEELNLEAKYKEGMAEGEAKGKAEGMAEGEAKGKAEGMAEGEAKGKAEGEAKGKAEGMAEGEAKGKAERNIELARKMLDKGRSMEEIVEFTELSVEEIKQLK